MAIDSNRPYQRLSVQANHNDTIWNGAAWGAGAGIGAMGLTYGVTEFGARELANLNYKVAGNKTIREQMRNDRLKAKGKPHLSEAALEGLEKMRFDKAELFEKRMAKVHHAGKFAFGSKKRMLASAATGLMGGMLIGSAVDYMN